MSVRFPFLKMIKWLRKASDLMPFPNWSDSDDTYYWTIQAISIGDSIAEETPNTIDDKICDFLEKVAANRKAWDLAYEILKFIIVLPGGDFKTALAKNLEACDTVASNKILLSKELGIDLSELDELLDAILELIEAFKRFFNLAKTGF